MTSQEIIDIIIPAAGESITTANVAKWHQPDGSHVKKGNVLVTLETDKVSNELEAEQSGILKIITPEGQEVAIGVVIGQITPGDPIADSEETTTPANDDTTSDSEKNNPQESGDATSEASADPPPSSTSAPLSVVHTPSSSPSPPPKPTEDKASRTTRKKMSMLRRKISTHLVNAQQTAAILTTFNEADMTRIMTLRKQIQESFIQKHEVKLGFMSFFIKAVVQALKEVPQVNGRIEDTDVIQNHYYDIGVAVGTEKGLVVPVIRDCEEKSFAEIEKDILHYAEKAREGTIQLDDLQGGCFTISNGGIYGSLLSTPILNFPQSGILGMHTIQDRPVVIDGKIEIRSMMYLAMSYDHRLVDGKEAVAFLLSVKHSLENPTQMFLDF